jgi:hypothetical protein
MIPSGICRSFLPFKPPEAADGTKITRSDS